MDLQLYAIFHDPSTLPCGYKPGRLGSVFYRSFFHGKGFPEFWREPLRVYEVTRTSALCENHGRAYWKIHVEKR